jgi:hypothetical protein
MGDAPPHDPEPVTGYTLNSVIEAAYSIASPYAAKAGALHASALNPMGSDTTMPVMIYSIVVGSDSSALESFTKLSDGTGGKVFTVATSDDVVGGVMDAIDEITMPANRPPICGSATASIQEIWPPNHNMKSVNIINVADPDGDTVTITITGITQDEPVKGNGSGNTAPDAEGVGTDTAKVRAERTGSVNGRVYNISFTAVDNKGLQCEGSVMTCVPHDKGENNVCVDDGQLYDSTGTEISLPGNIDKRGHSANRVDGSDLITLSIAFGSKSGDLNWNPSCDLDKDGASDNKIDGSDLIVLGTHFGEVGE